MKKHVKVLLAGIIVFAVGIVLTIAIPLMMIKDPADEAIHTLEYDTSGTQLVNLKKGEYDVWAEEVGLGASPDVEITNTDTDELIFSGPDLSIAESIGDIVKVGTLKVETSGEHSVWVDTMTTIYITEPIGGFEIFGGMCAGFIIALVGAIIGAVGFFMWLGSKKQQAQPQYLYPPQQYPPQQYPPQQSPPQQYPQQYPPQPPQQMEQPPSQTQEPPPQQ